MTSALNTTRLILIIAALAATVFMSGCAPLVVGGAAATTAIVATDRRTTGEQVEDQAIELKVSAAMREVTEGHEARINNISYAGRVVLTGDVPNQALKEQAGKQAEAVEKVKWVINELRVGEPTPLSVRTNDTWITSKVKTSLINAKEVPMRTILATTERGVVYLLGRVTDDEAQRAVNVVSTINGVNRVVKVFEIISIQQAQQYQQNSDAENNNTNNANTTGDGVEVQAIPVQ